jgi:hypothetical protein
MAIEKKIRFLLCYALCTVFHSMVSNLCWFFYPPDGISVSQIFIQQCLHQEHDVFAPLTQRL